MNFPLASILVALIAASIALISLVQGRQSRRKFKEELDKLRSTLTPLNDIDEERRENPRWIGYLPCIVRFGKDTKLGYILDYSIRGIRLRTLPRFVAKPGDMVKINIRGFPIDGRVIHISDKKSGTELGIALDSKRQQRRLEMLISG